LLRIRLSRHGAKKDPHYRVVVAEKRSPRDGRFVEIVGHYHPTMKPAQLELKLDRIDYWVGHGAQLSGTVKSLVKRAQTQPEEAPAEEPTKEAAPKKAAAEKKEAEPQEVKPEKAEAEEAKPEKAEPEEAAPEEKADEHEPEVAAET
ncbi:MAG: 30S ribosomal protein S16, partial [Acidobacteriota bacterium]